MCFEVFESLGLLELQVFFRFRVYTVYRVFGFRVDRAHRV